MTTLEEFLTTMEAVSSLELHLQTIKRLFRPGKLNSQKLNCGWVISKIELDFFGSTYNEVAVRRNGLDSITKFITPVSSVSSRMRETAELDMAGTQPLEIEGLIKQSANYNVVMYIVENTHHFPTCDEHLLYEKDIGDDNYPMVQAGDCPFHSFLGALIGYEKVYYDLAGYPGRQGPSWGSWTDVERERL